MNGNLFGIESADVPKLKNIFNILSDEDSCFEYLLYYGVISVPIQCNNNECREFHKMKLKQPNKIGLSHF